MRTLATDWLRWPTPERWRGTASRWSLAGWGGALVVLGWAARGSELDVRELARGGPFMADFLARLFPPNLGYAPRLVEPTLQTLQMALWGTLLAIGLAAPLGVLAARNLTPHPACYWAARGALNALRGINELVFALIFVSAVGLGPFPGVLALALHTAGMLGKFYAEAMEGVDPGPVQAVAATGAGRLQTIRWAVLPQVMPAVVAFNLYRFEVSVRSATVLGLVGAGGIGFELMSSMRLFRYRDTATILLVIVGLVVLTDLVSTRIRSRFI
jgi:phosphonate transport system permease protein